MVAVARTVNQFGVSSTVLTRSEPFWYFGGMKLADYLSRSAKSPEDFAREIEVDPVSVRRYLNGTRFPRRGVMDRIIRATDGAVTPNDFVEVDVKKVRRSRSSACIADAA